MLPTEQVEQPVSLSMNPYTGPWTASEASHLLRRCLFGPTFAQINTTVSQGMDASVNLLLSTPAFTNPLTYSTNEPVSGVGSTWVNSLYPASQTGKNAAIAARNESLGAWLMQRINVENYSLHEKMCLFWHNHFAAEATFDPKATFDYFKLIQTSALGNFRQFVKDMTINPSMLVFLTGTLNNQFSPNENYSRELLELYSIGKGPQIAEGDYTNYTEEDIHQGAKILTGWVIKDFVSETVPNTSSYFEPTYHDTTSKQLTSKFGSQLVTNGNANEYATYIDIIFAQPATAKFICQKIYRWFVNYDLTPTVDSTVINEMVNTLTANNFEILPVLNQLLKSEHFFDVSMRGAIIKNPLEELFSILNATQSTPNYDLTTNYTMYLNCYWLSTALGMNYLQPPSVGGWTSYYQAPNFSKLWANSSYIKLRFDYSSYITVWGGIDVNGLKYGVNHLAFLDGLSLPSDATQVIEDMVTVFCPKGLPDDKKVFLKTILLNGLPDFEWTVQYNEYLNNPGDITFSDPVKQRIALTMDQLFKQPEFQTI